MHKTIIFLLLIVVKTANAGILGISNPANMAGQQGSSVFAAGHYFAGSDYVAVNQFSYDWNGAYAPQSGTNLAVLNARLEAGANYNSWRIATLFRKEILIESNRDTTHIVYFNKQHLSVPAGQSFTIDLRVEGYEAEGVRLDKGIVLPRINEVALSAGAGISLLRGRSARIGRVDGTASSTLAGYTYDATIEDSNAKASYPFIRDATPGGQGYALDIGLKAVWLSGALLEVAANDLLGEIRWDNMPYTIETANSATLARDSSGYIYYNPTVSGLNDLNRRSFTHKLNPKVLAQFTYPLGKCEVSAGTDWMKGYWFPQLGMTVHLNETWQTSLDFDARFNTFGWGIKHKQYNLNLRSESRSFATAKGYGFTGGVKITF